MSWLFSRALVAEYSGGSCSGGEQSVQLNVMPTPHKFSRNGKTMEFSNLSRFGLTYAVLTESRGTELLTSFLADFRAKTSALPGKAQESTEKNPDCGSTWRALSMMFDRGSCSWKIHHSLFPEDLSESLVTLPSWGSMRDGELWERSTPGFITTGNVSGLLPTPTATDHKGSTPYQVQRRANHAHRNGLTLREFLAKYSNAEKTVYPNPGFLEEVMAWPQGWTELSPLETGKYRQWLQWHSTSCDVNLK